MLKGLYNVKLYILESDLVWRMQLILVQGYKFMLINLIRHTTSEFDLFLYMKLAFKTSFLL